jgi:membrane-associated phospholipid phosphatase
MLRQFYCAARAFSFLGGQMSGIKGLQSSWLSIVLIVSITFVVAQSVTAQTPSVSPQPTAQPTPQARPTPTLERHLLGNLLRDQAAIWTSPLRVRESDARWLAPLGIGTVALIATDRRTAGEVDDGGSLPSVSRHISSIGSGYATGGAALTFYLVGRARHEARARETGLLGAEALIDGGIVGQGLKLMTQRPRPLNDGGRGRFFTGGNSFPSGHAIAVWSLATVVAYEYGERRPLVRFGAYGLASAVSLSRYTGRKHFLSDALVGSAIGYGIGRYVYFKHHDRDLDTPHEQSSLTTRSKLLPLVSPYYRRGDKPARQYGIALAWKF